MKKGIIGNIYHISSDNYVSIKKLLLEISKIMKVDFKKNVRNVSDRKGKDGYYKLNSNKIKMIGSAKRTKPITAGKPIKRTNLIDQSKVFEKEVLSSLTKRVDKRGKITVPIAIAKIPKGNCISRSET